MWRIVFAVLVVCPAIAGQKQKTEEKRDAFAGVYQNDKVKLQLRAVRKHRYEGMVLFNGRVYPAKASADRETLEGTFADETQTFPFSATVKGERLELVTGGVTYALDRQVTVNPLARADRAAAPTGAGSNHQHQHPAGAVFRVPEGWTVRDTPAAASLLPPPGEPAGRNPEEIYVIASHDGFAGLDDPKLIDQLRRDLAGTGLRFDVAGEKETYSADGQAVTVLTWALKNPETGVPMMIRIFLAGSAGHIQSLAAIAARDRVLGWDPQLRLIAASMKYVQPAAPRGAPPDDDATEVWNKRLAGMVLTQSNSVAGFTSKKVIYLAQDHSFRYAGTAGAPGSAENRQTYEGRWRIVLRGDQALLELTLQDGTQNLLPLVFENGNTLLDGVPTFVTAP